MDHLVAGRVALIRRQCKHCGRNNHISTKCWEKFGHLEWTQLVDTDSLFAKVNDYVPIILFPISFFMIFLIYFFVSLPCLCLLSLFLGLMRRQYWLVAWK